MNTLTARNEESPAYLLGAKSDVQTQHEVENDIITKALSILKGRVKRLTDAMSSPKEVKDYLRLQLGGLDYEAFGVMFLDSQHALIKDEVMFRGTLGQTSVYPREIVKEALMCGAAAVVFYHNHPSGSVEPSRADETLTTALKNALNMVDVRVLDHIIVSYRATYSFAEKGLL